ncbi:MAG TPA: hypothetical protein VGQ89_02780 [Candidatus Limnocylindrales bacterium]|jgi:hypothetical protein|nr:hypothetical protein [Candidatus Limnocylindrales bacterium]
MTSKTQTLDSLPAAARDSATKARRILVVTGESDDDYARTRADAFDIAAATGADVVLYDHSAESHFVDPYLAGPVAAEVKGAHGESLLNEQAVETLGRAYLADQIREAKSHGVEAKAWLPLQTGRQGIAEGVSRFDADLVIVPEALAKDAEVGVPVLVVDATGKVAEARVER